MKKVLSLLLVCVMLLSFALVANAADEAYVLNLKYLKLNEEVDDMGDTVYSIGYDGSEMGTAFVRQSDNTWANEANGFVLAVSANVAASSGYFAIDYDEEVMTPAQAALPNATYNGIRLNPYTSNLKNALVMGSGVTAVETIVDADGYLVAWSSNGDLPANTVIANVIFTFKSGKSVADLNADSIKFAVVDTVKEAGTDAIKGNITDYDAAMAVFAGAAHGMTTASNANRNYPNVSEGLEPEVDAAGATETEINAIQDWTAGEFKYPTDTAGSTDTAAVGKKVAAFGKANVALEAEKYGVKIGNRYYPGKWDVPADSLFAIIVVNTDGDDAIEDSYTYSIYTGNANSNPTIIVENLPAVVK